jgi:hypothetical protein
MIRYAWRYREMQKGHSTGRFSRRHIARFIIWAIYSTRRKGALLSTSLGPATGRLWVDLDRGVLYGGPQPKRTRSASRVYRFLLACSVICGTGIRTDSAT